MAVEIHRHRRCRVALAICLSLTVFGASCVAAPSRTVSSACAQPAAQPVALVNIPGNPFQAIPTADGCHIFVSVAGLLEPSDPRRPPRPDASTGGIAVVSREAGEP